LGVQFPDEVEVKVVFLTVTAVTAVYRNIVINYLPGCNYLLAGISVVLLVLAALIIADFLRTWYKLVSGGRKERGHTC